LADIDIESFMEWFVQRAEQEFQTNFEELKITESSFLPEHYSSIQDMYCKYK
jgi:hypothetical protein